MAFDRARAWQNSKADNQLIKHGNCHFVSFVMHVSAGKFKEHCFNISRDILDWVLYWFSGTTYDVIAFLICIVQKRNISKTKKRSSQKENTVPSLFLKAFQISGNSFLLHRHFKLYCLLGSDLSIWLGYLLLGQLGPQKTQKTQWNVLKTSHKSIVYATDLSQVSQWR